METFHTHRCRKCKRRTAFDCHDAQTGNVIRYCVFCPTGPLYVLDFKTGKEIKDAKKVKKLQLKNIKNGKTIKVGSTVIWGLMGWN